MHEITLVQGLLGQLQQLAGQHNAAKIHRVKLEIGSRSGIVIDSFHFGFETLSAQDPLTLGAELEILVPKPNYRCCQCNRDLGQSEPESCSGCGSKFIIPVGNSDLILLQVEME